MHEFECTTSNYVTLQWVNFIEKNYQSVHRYIKKFKFYAGNPPVIYLYQFVRVMII